MDLAKQCSVTWSTGETISIPPVRDLRFIPLEEAKPNTIYAITINRFQWYNKNAKKNRAHRFMHCRFSAISRVIKYFIILYIVY